MRALLVASILAVVACGRHPPIPPRGVVEGDLGSWKFRRFQGPLFDVEVWVPGNTAEAYSASYVIADAEQRGRIEDKDLVNVFVTRYETPEGVVRATVKLARQLAQDGGYEVEEDEIAGARTLAITGRGEAWVMWPSGQHVVKIGGRGRSDVPRSMVAQYTERYPSRLPGGALEGPLPPGPDGAQAPSQRLDKPAYDPSSPRPDADHYDPDQVKLPGSVDREDPAGDGDGDGAGAAAGSAGPAEAGDPVKPGKPTRAKKLQRTKKPRRSR